MSLSAQRLHEEYHYNKAVILYRGYVSVYIYILCQMHCKNAQAQNFITAELL